MRKNLKMSIAGTFFVLLLFWVIIVETLAIHIFLLGLISIAAIIYISKEYILTEEVRFPLHILNLARIGSYILKLVYAIIVANIQVAQIVLSRDMHITPTFIRFKSPVEKDVTKAVLGNSITLTPGTLTVSIEEDKFVVHGLTRAHAENLLDWYMSDQLKLMEQNEKLCPSWKEETPSD